MNNKRRSPMTIEKAAVRLVKMFRRSESYGDFVPTASDCFVRALDKLIKIVEHKGVSNGNPKQY